MLKPTQPNPACSFSQTDLMQQQPEQAVRPTALSQASGLSRKRRVWLNGAATLGLLTSLLIEPAVSRAEEPGRAGSGAGSGSAHRALLGAADDITRTVVSLRGLSAKTTVMRGVLSRAEIGAKLRERSAQDVTPEELRIEAGVLKRLGLLPENADYEKLIFDLLTEQVAGFYEPRVRTLYIADWLPLDFQRPALAHEIEHALQDQHFDLRQFLLPQKDNGDRLLARSAVAEGDGVALMLEFSTRQAGTDPAKMPQMVAKLGKPMMQMIMSTSPSLQRAPVILRESLMFPYVAGLEFVSAHRGTGPWSRVDELFRSPPESTEQVLHPEKFVQHEQPVRITAAPLPTMEARKEVRKDVLGEMIYKVWFSGRSGEAAGAQAAAGWGGDRLVAYTQDGEALPALVMLSAWDTEADAEEAAVATRKQVLALTGNKDGSTSIKPASAMFARSVGGRTFATQRRERLVLTLCGVQQGSEAAVADEVFKLWKVEWPAVAPLSPPAVSSPVTPGMRAPQNSRAGAAAAPKGPASPPPSAKKP